MLGGKEGGGEPVTGREPHLQSGLPQLVHPMYPGHPSQCQLPALPLTQPGPPRGPGTSVPPREASGPQSFVPHPASSMEPGSHFSTTLRGGWEHRCLAQGGSWKPQAWISALSHRIKGAQNEGSLQGWARRVALE